MANIDLKTKMEIAEKYCLSPEGCPKLKGITDYNERLTKCAGCTNYLNKIDLVELLREFYDNSPTTTTSSTTSTFKGRGKNTEQSITMIKKILTLYHKEGYTQTRIARELHLSHRTVKNVLTLGFKNEPSNEKVRACQQELGVE